MKSTGTPFCQVSLPPATKLGQGYIFTGVCDSVHGGSASVHAGIPPPRPGTPQEQTHTPGSRPPKEQIPPVGVDTPCDSVHRGGLPQCMLGYHHPRTRHPPGQTPPSGADPPREQTPPRVDTPSPGADTPPRRRACWEIRSTRGRYASYWNAILFYLTLHELGRGVYPPTHTHTSDSLLPEFRISIDDR